MVIAAEGIEPVCGGEPHRGRFVGYLRVSTQRQGQSGLGIEAQREAIKRHLDGGRWKLLQEFVETESGRRTSRLELAKALAFARKHKATLVVSRLDRLARNTKFLLTLLDSKVDIEFCDFAVPPGATGRLILSVMASVAEFESRITGERTKAALKAARERNREFKVGGFNAQSARNAAEAAKRDTKLRPIIERIQRDPPAISATALAHELNERRVPTARKGTRWHAGQVVRLLARLDNTGRSHTKLMA